MSIAITSVPSSCIVTPALPSIVTTPLFVDVTSTPVCPSIVIEPASESIPILPTEVLIFVVPSTSIERVEVPSIVIAPLESISKATVSKSTLPEPVSYTHLTLPTKRIV